MDPLDLITQSQFKLPSYYGAPGARSGAGAQATPTPAPTLPTVPNIFERPAPGAIVQPPDPVVPTPAPAPSAPAAPGIDPSVLQQALLLQGLIGGQGGNALGMMAQHFGIPTNPWTGGHRVPSYVRFPWQQQRWSRNAPVGYLGVDPRATIQAIQAALSPQLASLPGLSEWFANTEIPEHHRMFGTRDYGRRMSQARGLKGGFYGRGVGGRWADPRDQSFGHAAGLPQHGNYTPGAMNALSGFIAQALLGATSGGGGATTAPPYPGLTTNVAGNPLGLTTAMGGNPLGLTTAV